MYSGTIRALVRGLTMVVPAGLVITGCGGDEPFGGDKPVIAFSVGSVDFSATATVDPAPAERTIEIRNGASSGSATEPSTGLLSGLKVDRVGYAAGGPTGWLDANLSGSADPAVLTVKVKTTVLSPGAHTAFVVLSSTKALRPDSVRINYAVAIGPTLSVSPTSITFPTSYVGGQLPASQLVDVRNGSSVGSIADLAIGAITPGAGQSPGWIGAAWAPAPRPGAVRTLVLTVPTGLAAGNYSATVPITSTVAGTQSITAGFRVDPAPVISLNPASLSFDSPAGGEQPPEKSAALTNGGGSALSGIGVSVSYSPPASAWLSATLDGQAAPTTLRVRPIRTDLAPGTHKATVRVTSTLVGVAPVDFEVSYAVRAVPVLRAVPATVQFAGIVSQAAPLPQVVAISNAGSGGSIGGLTLVTTHDQAVAGIDAVLDGTATNTSVTITPKANLAGGLTRQLSK